MQLIYDQMPQEKKNRAAHSRMPMPASACTNNETDTLRLNKPALARTVSAVIT